MSQPTLIDAAVLMPLVWNESGNPCLVFTKRTEKVRHHKGQICFPGGVREASDSNLWETAARETFEETGWEPHRFEKLATLTALSTPTGFNITPFVAKVSPWQDYKINPDEIAELFTVPLSHLLNPQNTRLQQINHEGQRLSTPLYQFNEHVIWGATGRMIFEFLNSPLAISTTSQQTTRYEF